MPVPAGYKLDTPIQNPSLPAGYKLDDAPTPTPAPPIGVLKSIQNDFDKNVAGDPNDSPLRTGLKAVTGAIGNVFVHPLDTAAGMAKSLVGSPDYPQLPMRLPGGKVDVPSENPISQQAEGVAQDYKQGGLRYAAPKLAGQVLGGAIVGRLAGELPSVPDVAVGAADTIAAKASRLRPKSSPAIVTPEEVQAQKIAQSILPPGGIKPELVKSIQAEAPAVVEYAQRTGNPLNTQAEGLKAAQGVAQEGLQHFNDEVIRPFADDRVVLGQGKAYQGFTGPKEGDLQTATLGEVADQITALNKKVNLAKASNSGEALMMLEKSGIQDQLAHLRSILYDNLSKKSGISPEDLQTLREGYGGQFTMADGLESAQNARLTRTGQISQGQQSISIKPPSVLELPGRAYQFLRGGEQAVADRQFSNAIKQVQPQSPLRPMPNIPEPVSANPAPTAAPVKTMQRWADTGEANILQHAPDTPPEVLRLAQTNPSTRQMLIRASDLTPGSTAMRNLLSQIKTTLGVNQ